MSEVEGKQSRWQYGKSVREHVRGPLDAARERIERERAELLAERTAFERFSDRVEGIAPAGTDAGPPLFGDGRGAERRAAVREAYRETVMAVDHYGAVYDEPLLVNVAGELSADVAEALRDEAGVPFSRHLRSTVCAAAEDAAERRAAFHEHLVDERESIEVAREDLGEITDALDGSGLPARHRPSFDGRLDELVRRRRRRLQSRTARDQDGHDLCEYVYDEEDWVYPVLTAVARLRNSVA